jgi:acetylornithine deacetylase
VNLFELAKDLINIESISGHEAGVAKFLQGTLRDLKLETELQPVEGDRANLLAWHGEPRVVLGTHMDTVPPFIPADEDEDHIYGRGSCDAKGILAAQVAAAERLLSEGVTDFGLLFLVGEENISEGARRANQSPRGSRYCVMGEPTENRLGLGCKGALRVLIKTRGRMAHSAYPHWGVSAIEKLLDILVGLRKLNLPRHSVLGDTTYTIGTISGGRAANVIPDEAEAVVLFRMTEESRVLRRDLEALVGDRGEVEYLSETPPLMMEKLDGFETEVFPFTTDLPWLTQWGRPLLLGPGSVRLAHTEREAVAKKDLLQAVGLYTEMVGLLQAKDKGAAERKPGANHP